MWVKQLYPDAPLLRIPVDHPLFKAGYPIKTLRYAVARGRAEFAQRTPEVYGVRVGGRLRVVYVPHSLGHTWRTRPFEPPCRIKDEDGRKLTVNIILYALQ